MNKRHYELSDLAHDVFDELDHRAQMEMEGDDYDEWVNLCYADLDEALHDLGGNLDLREYHEVKGLVYDRLDDAEAGWSECR